MLTASAREARYPSKTQPESYTLALHPVELFCTYRTGPIETRSGWQCYIGVGRRNAREIGPNALPLCAFLRPLFSSVPCKSRIPAGFDGSRTSAAKEFLICPDFHCRRGECVATLIGENEDEGLQLMREPS